MYAPWIKIGPGVKIFGHGCEGDGGFSATPIYNVPTLVYTIINCDQLSPNPLSIYLFIYLFETFITLTEKS